MTTVNDTTNRPLPSVPTHEHVEEDGEKFCAHRGHHGELYGVWLQPSKDDRVFHMTEEEAQSEFEKHCSGREVEFRYTPANAWEPNGKLHQEHTSLTGRLPCLGETLVYQYTPSAIAYAFEPELEETIERLGPHAIITAFGTFEGWETPGPNIIEECRGDFPPTLGSTWLDYSAETWLTGRLASTCWAQWDMRLDPRCLEGLGFSESLTATSLKWRGVGKVYWDIQGVDVDKETERNDVRGVEEEPHGGHHEATDELSGPSVDEAEGGGSDVEMAAA